MKHYCKTNFHKIIKIIFTFLLFSFVFSLAYAQSPLFTSNQNQYFLHGLANAGFGELKQDWLANTIDPTPIFSAIVKLSYQYIRIEIVYLFYALLLGIYLFSVIGIVSTLFDIQKSNSTFLVYLALLVLVHSAAFRFVISRALGNNWTYILEDGFADQRLLGPVFQPSTFGVFLILSLYLFMRNKPFGAILSVVIAAILHPTYLLSAMVLTFTYMLVTFFNEQNIKKSMLLGLFALVIVSPILFYVFKNFGNTSLDTTASAHEILVNFRIPHHALYTWWLDATVIVKLAIIVFALYLIRNTKLFVLLLVPFLIAGLLSIVQIISGSNTLALLFPWRLSTFIVPLSTSLILARLVIISKNRFSEMYTRSSIIIRILSYLIITLVVISGLIRMKLEFERKASANDRSMMAFIEQNQIFGEIYLTPIKMQDFRLVTGSPVYVDFKSIPYLDTDFLEWYKRIRLAEQFYKKSDCSALNIINEYGGINHVVISNENIKINCPQLSQIYKDEYFSVFQLQTP